MDTDRIECVLKAFRTAGGMSPLINSAGTFVTTERFDDPRVTADRSALPPWNSREYEVTLTSPHPVCLRCGVTAPSHGHPGGGIECVAAPDQFASCSVKHNRTGSQMYQGPCEELADRLEPRMAREGTSILEIGLGVFGALALGGFIAALLSGGAPNNATLQAPSLPPPTIHTPNPFNPSHSPHLIPPYRMRGSQR